MLNSVGTRTTVRAYSQDSTAPSCKTFMPQRIDRIAAGLVMGAMLLTAAVLISLYDPRLINPDTIQLVDAARHLLAGDGFSTSIILYESQLQFSHVPAPLTVWPPGLSWLVLLPMKLGMSGEAAAFVLCVIGHLVTTWLIFVLARRFAGPWIAAIAAIAWLLHAIALMMVLALYAEPIFIAFTLASYFALIEAGKEEGWSMRWLLLAGAAAACSILMRYSGVLWPAAAGLWLLWAAVRGRSWQPIRAAFIFGALPALTTIALFLRNFLLTGRFSGGQFEYGGPAGVLVVARHLLWDSNMILGKVLRMSPIMFALVVATLIVAIVLAARKLRASEPRDAATGLAISSIVVLVAFLVGNAIKSSLVFVDYRYWLPALPFLAILLSSVAHDAVVAMPARASLGKTTWPAAVLASCAILTISVLAALPERWPIRTAHPTVAVVEQALAQRMPDGRTVREALTSGDVRKPLLAHLEQRFYAQTGRAVVGLIDANYTKRVWTRDEVKQLVQQYGIEQVVFFPSAFRPALVESSNQQFWNELLGGHVPLWLKPHYVSERIVLYDVVAPELRHTE
jgi:4-amino-4-deoxy-L-arabinose transferase-like glycosyltransferase